MSVDRSAKHRLERLSKMVPTLKSDACHRGDHAACPYVYAIKTGEVMEQRVLPTDERGAAGIADTIGKICGCPCHKEKP